MNNIRCILFGIFLAFYCVLPVISKVYDRYFFSNQRQDVLFQEKETINDYTGKELSAHYVMMLCNIIGLFSAVIFIVLSGIVRLKRGYQLRQITEHSTVKETISSQKEPFILRAATVWVLAILIAAVVFLSIIYLGVVQKP